MNNQRILALVCEPWQTKAMAKLLLHLEASSKNSEYALGVMDYYQMVHRLNTFDNLKLPTATLIRNQDQLYKDWQDSLEDESKLTKINLDEWEKKNCSSRSLKEISEGNQLIRQWERSQYTLPISEYWERRVLHDTIKWCEDFFAEFKPTVVISIERFELANSIFFEICKREKIPMLTFIGSRIESRWILRDDFGYGISDENLDKVAVDSQESWALDLATKFVETLRNSNSGAYSSDSRILSELIDRSPRRKVLNLYKDSRKLAGNIYARHFLEPKNYAIKVVRFEENHFRLTYYLIRRLIIRNLRSFGVKVWGETKIPKLPYLVWALHYRPETSGLVLGDGRDEIEELENVARQMPAEWILAVKENSLMLGERFPGFYRKLKSNPKIRVIDAHFDTSVLIKQSMGVVGISGTALLEAGALGIPSCVLGKPEFNRMFTHNGWHSFGNFVKGIQTNEQFSQKDSERVLKYVAYVYANSSNEDVRYLSDETAPELNLMMKRFAEEVSKYVDTNVATTKNAN
jgi:hypothetical protein